MTAPITPSLTWEVKAVLAGMLAFLIAIPFVRREDWVGRLALLALFGCMVDMWILLIRGIALHTLRWWRCRGERD